MSTRLPALQQYSLKAYSGSYEGFVAYHSASRARLAGLYGICASTYAVSGVSTVPRVAYGGCSAGTGGGSVEPGSALGATSKVNSFA